jgi:hypothetical protein
VSQAPQLSGHIALLSGYETYPVGQVPQSNKQPNRTNRNFARIMSQYGIFIQVLDKDLARWNEHQSWTAKQEY